MLAGYFRGRFETLVVGGMDVLLAFPPLILVLAVIAFVGQSIFNLTLILGVLSIPAFMRVARAATLTLSRREFVIAAQALGASHARILLRELLPNVILPLFAFFLLGVAVIIVVEGSLSFLGLGVPPPISSWGSMIGEGRESLDIAPRLAFLPAVAMFLTVLSFNLVGDTLAGADRSAAGRAVTDTRAAFGRGCRRSICRRRAAICARWMASISRSAPGSTLGIVGESGCGKTMLSRAILQLLPKKAKLSGRVMFDGQDLVSLDREKLRKLRGRSLAVVFQDPMTSLNPVLTIGTQLIETLQEHLELDLATAKKRSVELLAAVGIPAPEQRLTQYPHQLSGGMRQRVAIAIALSCEPELLIADEPTTALDVTIQAQILDLLAREQRRRHMAMIIITHDLGVVAGRTDEVAVMYAGRVVEQAPTQALFKKMRMPYTEALLAAIPKIDAKPHSVLPAISGRPPDPTRPLKGCSFSPRCRYALARLSRREAAVDRGGNAVASIRLLLSHRDQGRRSRMMQQSVHPSADPLLKVDNLVVEYSVGGKTVHAVSGVSLEIARGETLGLVGESGCGKSTLGRAVLQLRQAVSGKVLFDGNDLTAMHGDPLRKMRQRVQLIFQDPIASLNPRRRIGDIVAEPLVIAGVKDPGEAQATGFRRAHRGRPRSGAGGRTAAA